MSLAISIRFLTGDRKSTRLNSTLFPYTTLFRSPSGRPRHRAGSQPRTMMTTRKMVGSRNESRDLHPLPHWRSEEHTSELHSLSLHDALPISKWEAKAQSRKPTENDDDNTEDGGKPE